MPSEKTYTIGDVSQQTGVGLGHLACVGAALWLN
jgi:hypothetical protein